MFKFKNLKTICFAAVLSLGLAACGGGDGDQGMMEPPPPPPVAVDLSGVTAGYMAAAGTVEIAAGHSTTVGDVTFSCAADGADCTVTVAADGTATATADSGMVSAANSSTYQARLDMDAERMTVSTAVMAAMTAVSELTDQSSDADIVAAQTAIDDATAAVGGTTSLPASEIVAFQTQIATAQSNLNTAETNIANYRTHGTQHATASGAVDRATIAVGNLTATSSDADVTAAETAIAAAKAAVADGTLLTPGEVAELNGEIRMAETDLGTAKTTIANYRTHDGQITEANTKVAAATEAVAELTAMSSDADVTEAANAITAAEAAVAAGTMLTASEIADLNGKIAIAKVDLGNARTTIANYRTRVGQMTAANTAVEQAEMAVAALDINSSDEAVTDAEIKIAAAKTAVMAGTMLSADETAALNGKITTAETTLGNVKTQIAIRKDGETATEIVRLHGEASGATTDAEDAGDKAATAVETADDYSEKIDVMSVKGDSSVAQANAQMVLDARDDADEAVTEAGKAKTRADTAKTAADAIADGTAGKTAVVNAINAAIMEAETQIAATKAIQTGKNADDSVNHDGVKLRLAVEAVTGTDEDDLKTPTERGEEVAMAVGRALLAANTDAATLDGTPEMVTHYDTVASLNAVLALPDEEDRTFHDKDSRGDTWEEIVGEANVARERIGTNNALLPVAPISGEASDFDPDESILGPTGGVDGMYADVFSTDGGGDVNYKGILGTVYCLGGTDGCSVDGDGNLVGGWYFTPSLTTALFIPDDDGTGYVQDTAFSQWGHWLAVDTAPGGTGQVTIHTYATTRANTANLNVGVSTASPTVTETATYNGDAVGMSVHKELDTNGKQESISSGAFTAAIELRARFGASPMLGGMIKGFESESGLNTDSDWEVTLAETALDTTNANVTAGVAQGTGQAGDWTAQGYGPVPVDTNDSNTNQRPTGFFGNFNAHFTDGHAAGAYVTRK